MLPLFLLKGLAFISPFKKLLTPKNIAIAVGIAVLAYFIWSYNSMRTELGEYRATIDQSNAEVSKANKNLDSCYSDVEKLNTNIVELQKEYDATLNSALSKMQSLCVRKDTITQLNKKLKEKGIVVAPDSEKPKDVIDLQNSLNDRLNNRGFE